MKDGSNEFKKTLGQTFFIIGIILIAFVIIYVSLVFVGFSEVPLKVYETDETSSELEEWYEKNNMSGVPNLDDYMGGYYPMMNLMIWVSVSFALLMGGYFLCKIGFMFMESKKEDKGQLNHPLIKRRKQQIENSNDDKKGWI